MDNDLPNMSREELIAEVKGLREAIRRHRDSTEHELCWHHPQLWELLPERVAPDIAVPPWPKFLRGCVKYRESLDRELAHAPHDVRAEGAEGDRPPRRALKAVSSKAESTM
jgi:hypothetical protein